MMMGEGMLGKRIPNQGILRTTAISMAVPKKRQSKMKTRQRKANWFAKARRQADLAWNRAKSVKYDPLEDPKYSLGDDEDEDEEDDEGDEGAMASRAGDAKMMMGVGMLRNRMPDEGIQQASFALSALGTSVIAA